ncbi:MAG TPA: hypothetical protein VFK27_02215, partial [Bacillales bacterium]|nr:hypothetical protein [Bacillales bacterium]
NGRNHAWITTEKRREGTKRSKSCLDYDRNAARRSKTVEIMPGLRPKRDEIKAGLCSKRSADLQNGHSSHFFGTSMTHSVYSCVQNTRQGIEQ